MKQRKKVWRKKRPVAVPVVGWVILVLFVARLYQAVLPLLAMGLLRGGIHGPFTHGLVITPIGLRVLDSALFLFQVLAGIVVLIGFLRLRRWAWVLLMAWTGASLTVSLIGYFYGRPNYLVMASDVVIALALSQHDVQRIFQIRYDPDEPSL